MNIDRLVGMDWRRCRKITVVLEAFVQTSYETYTHKYKTVDIEVPDDGNEWHVVGEMENRNEY